jgi:hypothetical protein
MDRNLQNAYSRQVSLEVERSLGAGRTGSVGYQYIGGENLIMSVNQNVPTCVAAGTNNGCRANATYRNNNQYSSVSMKTLPYGGSSFPDVRISEEGRAFLAARLGKLTATQVRDLFVGARVAQYPHANPAQHDVENWVQAFQTKVRAITDRAPCPGGA